METAYPRPRTDGLGRRIPQTNCKLCKRRQVSWKDPRGRPYEKFACDHESSALFKPTCRKCHLQLQEDNEGRVMSCTSPECGPTLLWLPQHDSANAGMAEPTPSRPRLILRTYCRSCRVEGVVCSGSITGPRCGRCEELDLECDCRVLRRGCEDCMKERQQAVWRTCIGFHDACDSCIAKGIQCKEYAKGSQSQGPEEKKSKDDAVAYGAMDVIDGMKATRAFAACERCSEEKLRCDENLPGCGSCAQKGVECRYKLLSTAFSEFSRGRQKKRWGSLYQVNPEKCEEADNNDMSWTRVSEDEALEERTEGSGNGDIGNRLGNLMNDLELEDWHFVSREEVEEALEASKGRV